MIATATRTLPASLDAEQSVLGGILLRPHCFALVSDLDAGDFHHPTHESIFAAMATLHANGQPIDPVSVPEAMRAAGTYARLAGLNGEAYFADLMMSVVIVDNIGHHAAMVRGKATARRLIEAAQEIAARGYGEHGDIDAYVADALQTISEISRRTVRSRLVSQSQSLRAALREAEAAYTARQAGVAGGLSIPTGFRRIDGILHGGLRTPRYHVIAGRPGDGKTSLMMDIVEHAATVGARALVLSREMAHWELSQRRLSAASGVDGGAIQSGDLHRDEFAALSRAGSSLSVLDISYEDSAAELRDLCAIARRWRASGKPDARAVVALDFIQRVQVTMKRKAANRYDEITYASGVLKDLFGELSVAGIVCSQLNRQGTGRSDPRPQLSDLRESGAIEADADVVCFVYHPKDLASQVIFAKQKHGSIGTVPVGFDREHTRFYELSAAQAPYQDANAD